MRKRIIVISIILASVALLFSGCSSKDLTEKENRCLSYKADINDKVLNDPKEGYISGSIPGQSPDHTWIQVLKEVFYSPKLDTCVYVADKTLLDGPYTVSEDYIVRDYYNEKELNSFKIIEQRNSTGNLGKFEEYILKIKK